jgi:hypothetical protein
MGNRRDDARPRKTRRGASSAAQPRPTLSAAHARTTHPVLKDRVWYELSSPNEDSLRFVSRDLYS